MANEKPKTEQPKTESARQGGRPAKPTTAPGDVKGSRVANLQYTLDRACNFIHDGASSYATKARSAARAGVERRTVEAGLDAMAAALADARAVVERAYNEPAKAAAPKSRVALVV